MSDVTTGCRHCDSWKTLLRAAALAAFVLGVHLPRAGRPFGGHFASYQSSVMAAISRNMLRENLHDSLIPKIDLIVGGARAWHLNQYPFPSLLAAAGTRFLGGSLEFWGRFQAIFCNALSILLMGLIAGRLLGAATAWPAAILYGLSPYALIYGQAFMSEAMALTGLLVAFWVLLKIRDEKRESVWLVAAAGLFFSTAVTGRVHFILLFPALALTFLRGGRFHWKQGFVFSFIAFLLPVLWYGWTYFISQDSSHVITNIFIQKAVRPMGAVVYLKEARFYRRVFEILAVRMLTPLGAMLAFAGLWRCARTAGRWIVALGLASGALLAMLLPQKIMAHDFYLYAFFPFYVFAAAAGWTVFTQRIHSSGSRFVSGFARRTLLVLAVILYAVFSLWLAWNPLFKNPDDTPALPEAAQMLRQKTRPDEKLIIFGTGPAVMVYYADRPCWTMEPEALGKPLNYYFKNSEFSGADMGEVTRYETAMKDFVLWVQYLVGQGAQLFLAKDKSELEKYPALLDFLTVHAQRLSPPESSWVLYRF